METPLEYSGTGLAFTEGFEGCKLTSYQDSGGIWTIGYGHIAGISPDMNCTQEQADLWLKEDTQSSVDTVNRLVDIQLNQEEFDALVDFVFNLGAGSFASSSMLKYINSNKLDLAALEFQKWDHCGGKVVQGLLNRRIAEQKEFNHGV